MEDFNFFLKVTQKIPLDSPAGSQLVFSCIFFSDRPSQAPARGNVQSTIESVSTRHLLSLVGKLFSRETLTHYAERLLPLDPNECEMCIVMVLLLAARFRELHASPALAKLSRKFNNHFEALEVSAPSHVEHKNELREVIRLITFLEQSYASEEGEHIILNKVGRWGISAPFLLGIPAHFSPGSEMSILQSALPEPDPTTSVYARRLRILQWEVMNLDWRTLALEERSIFKASTPALVAPAVAGADWLDSLCKEAWLSEITSIEGLESSFRNGNEAASRLEGLASFSLLLRAGPDRFVPRVFDAVVASLNYGRSRNPDSWPLFLIPDGELTFFALLWLLRFGVAMNDDLEAWLTSNGRHAVQILPVVPQEETDQTAYAVSMDYILELLGLACVSSEDSDKLILTSRWRSLMRWLHILHLHASRDNFPEMLGYPFKQLEWDNQEKKVRKGIIQLLRAGMGEFVETRKASRGDIAAWLLQFFKNAKRAGCLEALSPGLVGLHDRLIARLCRAPYLPLEVFLRASCPFPMHLLIIAGQQPQFHGGGNTDTSPRPPYGYLSFCTIAGEAPGDVEMNRDWLSQYWQASLFLAGEAGRAEAMREATEWGSERRARNQYMFVVHEVGKLVPFICKDSPKIVLDLIQLYFLTLFPDLYMRSPAAQPTLASGYYPQVDFMLNLEQAISIKALAQQAFLIAMVIVELTKALKQNRSGDVERESFIEELKDKSDDEFSWEGNDELVALEPRKKLYMAGAFIVAFRNAVEHRRIDNRISCKLDTNPDAGNARVLAIRNTSDKLTISNAQSSTGKQYGTAVSLEFLAEQYNCLARAVRFDLKTGMLGCETMVPISIG